MRTAIVIVLAIIAVAASGVWALGQFGANLTGGVGAPRAPIIREPEIVVATAPAQPPAPNTQPALRSAPAPASTAENPAQPASAPPAPATEAIPPAADPSAPPAPPNPNLRSTLDPPSLPIVPDLTDLPSQKTTAPAATPEALPPSAPAAQAEVQLRSAPAALPEPRVLPQQPGATITAPPAGLEAQFKSRQVTYNRPPEKLALDKPIDVSLVINATADADAGKEALEGFPGTVVERDVELSDTVSAQLTGVGFDITSQTVQRQRLSGKTLNRWAWRVTPTQIGQHTLILEIFGYASGSLDAEPLDAYRDVITVEVQQFEQIVSWARSVQPVFALLAALAAVGSAIFAFLRFREEKKQTKAIATKSE
jgi:hypothetical protein